LRMKSIDLGKVHVRCNPSWESPSCLRMKSIDLGKVGFLPQIGMGGWWVVFHTDESEQEPVIILIQQPTMKRQTELQLQPKPT
jgi:hypothetical protein